MSFDLHFTKLYQIRPVKYLSICIRSNGEIVLQNHTLDVFYIELFAVVEIHI